MVNKKNSSFVVFLIMNMVLFVFLSGNLFPKKKGKNYNGFDDKGLNKVLKWRSIGPYRGGRVVAVAGHPTKKNCFYFGGTGSGIWKTQDGGKIWKNVSDGFLKTSSIGAIAISSSSPNTIYVGTGECCLRGNISHGDGIYKSVNGGRTWKNIGLINTKHISRIRIDAKDPDHVYVAALGHAFGPNRERGVYETVNGGKTWKNILFVDKNSGAIDLIINPEEPKIMFAAFWQVRRYPWGFESGGAGSSIYKSIDGGKSWNNISLNAGLPSGIKGRIGLSLSMANPERIWAIIESKKSGIYLSEDSGDNWTKVSTKADLLQRPWYYSHIKADPVNPDRVYVMNVGFWRTDNRGKTFKKIRTPHGDNHDLWIDPIDPNRMIEANDGGATVTFDGGKNWSSVYNQPTSQFYHVTTDKRTPYRVYGAQQDNSTISIPSRSRSGSITMDQSYSVGGCESGYIAIDPKDQDIYYAGCYDGLLTRYDRRNRLRRDISVWPENPMGAGAKDLKYRFQWTFPILFSLHDSKLLYTAGNHLFKSLNEGQSWEKISPDLTRNDKSKMESSGGPITKDNTSVEYYGTIFAVAESPVKKGVIWTGSDDGLIHLSRDSGKNWENVTPKNLPEWSLISIIEASGSKPGTAYIAATRYKLDDYLPYLYKTENYGKSWKKIVKGLPVNSFTRVIREYRGDKDYLFCGTETGVYFSTDDGKLWRPLQLNLPVTPIHDIRVHKNSLVLGTHGRSFWILDDLSLLVQLLNINRKTEVTLFKPGETIRLNGRFKKNPVNAGESLPIGVIVNYFLEKKPEKNIQIIISDSKGKAIKTFSSKKQKKGGEQLTRKKGLNSFVWNMSYPAEEKVKGAIFWFAFGDVTPKAVPGNYKISLEVDNKSYKQDFEITGNASISAKQEDYQKKFDLLLKIRDKVTETHRCVNRIRDLRKQITNFMKRKFEKKKVDKLGKLSESIKKKMLLIESELIQHKAKATQDLLNYPIKLNNKLASLASSVSFTESAPTDQALLVYEDLSKRVDIQLKKFVELLSTEIKEFNDEVWKLKIPLLSVKKREKR